MSTKDIYNISKELQKFINFEARKMIKKQESYRLKYENLVGGIKDIKTRNKEWIESAKEQGFSVNLAEAEGYQRAILDLEYLLEE